MYYLSNFFSRTRRHCVSHSTARAWYSRFAKETTSKAFSFVASSNTGGAHPAWQPLPSTCANTPLISSLEPWCNSGLGVDKSSLKKVKCFGYSHTNCVGTIIILPVYNNHHEKTQFSDSYYTVEVSHQVRFLIYLPILFL